MAVVDEPSRTGGHQAIDDIYAEAEHWELNTGKVRIHAKRSPGRFRRLKWFTQSVWLIFFLGPYLRWDDRQAVLFDLPNRQFHLFGVTVMPQDIWMLAMILVFFALLMAAVTSIAGRVFCGFFCFQTAWTDLFTLIEEYLEGPPHKRRKLDKAPWTGEKIRLRTIKFTLWLLISMLTGVTFAAWFTDAFQLWHDYFTLSAHPAAWVVLGLFTAGTFINAGLLREQVCFWLCPYARIQGTMYDEETILPTYDERRGEPRGKLHGHRGADEPPRGDCIDCNLCVAVCPTGIDIRDGQQEGCITCALCIDACDEVMDKLGKPHGLIRYASLDEMKGKPAVALLRRPRVIVYFAIMALATAGIVYGLLSLGAVELTVLHERQPLYVQLSDGSIQNKFTIKVLNKTNEEMEVIITASGIDGMTVIGLDENLLVPRNHLKTISVFIRVPAEAALDNLTPVTFSIESVNDPERRDEAVNNFVAP